MSAQTPQTDAARILWRDIGKPLSPDASTNADYGYYVSAQLFRTLEADRDRLKALCEELRGALHEIAKINARTLSGHSASDSLEACGSVARAALKKAQKDI